MGSFGRVSPRTSPCGCGSEPGLAGSLVGEYCSPLGGRGHQGRSWGQLRGSCPCGVSGTPEQVDSDSAVCSAWTHLAPALTWLHEAAAGFPDQAFSHHVWVPWLAFYSPSCDGPLHSALGKASANSERGGAPHSGPLCLGEDTPLPPVPTPTQSPRSLPHEAGTCILRTPRSTPAMWSSPRAVTAPTGPGLTRLSMCLSCSVRNFWKVLETNAPDIWGQGGKAFPASRFLLFQEALRGLHLPPPLPLQPLLLWRPAWPLPEPWSPV